MFIFKKLIDFIKYVFISIFFGTDRTYNKTIGVGSFEVSPTLFTVDASLDDDIDDKSSEPKEKGNSFQKALISFRWTKNRFWQKQGGQVVLTRQAETTDKTFELAKKLVEQMRKELLENKRFFGKEEEFAKWCNNWAETLERKYHFKDVKKKG